ncbi:MAG: hypothetical protein IJB04_07945 [Oscillospiraceae bacterium]|nr:hypothetical protein [Oscillospiraceae bacterium]
MSYEGVSKKSVSCACGKGRVVLTVSENDWNQVRESVSIECEYCRNVYRIESKYCCPKPMHDYTIYYLVEIDNPGNKRQLDL